MIKYHINNLGDITLKEVFHNLCPSALVEHAILNGEGVLSNSGALIVNTGAYTGRAANDRFIVDTRNVHSQIAWGQVNKPISPEQADRLMSAVAAYMQNRRIYVFDGYAGADKNYRHSFRVITELASQNLFIHQLLIRRGKDEPSEYSPEFTVVVMPNFKCPFGATPSGGEAAIIIDIEKKLVLIVGTKYSGEIKKSIFSIMNFLVPRHNVLPMHCSANMDSSGNIALFFGLSGTGKTTLSADSACKLIGDDEHGWSDESIFNFEGGCYAKCANLSKESEPEIFNAIRFGTIVENVPFVNKSRTLDFKRLDRTENTRAGYPVSHMSNIQPNGYASGAPKTIFFLTADAYGVIPPISRLTKNQAMYYFISGFTAKIAGTENGISEPVPTFSACFGEPFLPLRAEIYTNMLKEKLDRFDTEVYLVNTGWNGSGKRINLKYTRAMIHAALNGSLRKVGYNTDPVLGLSFPVECPNVPADLLFPEKTWGDKEQYLKTAGKLADMFRKNIERYPDLDASVAASGPKCRAL